MAVALLFPGQGSQYVGMGKDLVEAFPAARELFARAEAVLGFPLQSICFEGPEEVLVQTQYTQPAIFVHSCAALKILEQAGLHFDGVAGHSLGEYSALVAAGVLEFETALRLVATRGKEMQEAGRRNPGTMAAVLGLSPEDVERVCVQARNEAEWVGPANFNAPGQIVISGSPPAVERAAELARQAGAKRVIPLPVSGAFHSPLMAPAAESFAKILQDVELNPARVPVYCNSTGQPERDPRGLREALQKQLSSPVLWEQSLRRMLADGFDTFYEVGPGNVLLGLLRRVDREAKGMAAGKAEELREILNQLRGAEP
ncbi:MAG: ACP S-malonyltransferase [candidate division KSB1 bacterium]|nr:ACP S-malonyltransferase [candidate division KSB1 bacterium]